MVKEWDSVDSCFQMVPNSKDIVEIIELTEKADWFILMEMFMRGNGLMIKHMERENIPILMVQFMMEIFSKMSNKERVLKLGLMEQNLRGTM